MSDDAYSKAATDRLIDVGGVEIHYNEAGDGPALLCTHGGGPGANGWDNTKYAFRQLAQHFRVILMDHPNYGESQKHVASDARSPDLFLATLQRDLLDRLGIERASLYGSSAFGATTIRFGLEFPERTDKLIVQAYAPRPAPDPNSASDVHQRGARTPGLQTLQDFANDPSMANMQRMCEYFVPRDDLRTVEFVEARFRAATIPGHLESRGAFAGGTPGELVARLPELQIPVLVLWGQADGMIPVGGVLDALRLFPNCQAHVWGGQSGHFVVYEHPDEFARLVVDFAGTGPNGFNT